MARTLDPEGAHLAALRRLADFRGARVLEMGCGEGRLTGGIAAEAASVLAFDPDSASISQAEASLPSELAERVAFRVASAEAIEIEPGSFDLVVFSWALDVRKHYSDGAELVEDVAGSKRRFPDEVVPVVQRIEQPLVVRERCRARRLRVLDRDQ